MEAARAQGQKKLLDDAAAEDHEAGDDKKVKEKAKAADNDEIKDDGVKSVMEELMPELVGLVLSYVDHPGCIVCCFMSTTWMCASPAPTTDNAQEANSCPWDNETCSAAEGGHLEVLQWAWANSCPWDEHTCMAAAEGGHLEVLQWARANGQWLSLA